MGNNKDNMRQAMKELLGMVGVGEEDAAAETVEAGPEAAPVRGEAPRVERVAEPERQVFAGGFPQRTPGEPVEEPSVADDPFFQEGPMFAGGPAADTVISEGTALFGDLRADGDVDIRGTLKGNLQATGRVRVFGKVLGDIKGSSVELISCAVQGNITATDSVSLDQGTVLIGDVTAGELTTDGKMKGSAIIERAANFRSGAVLAGNVTASLVSMSEGAKIQGTVRISQDEKTDALFDAALNI